MTSQLVYLNLFSDVAVAINLTARMRNVPNCSCGCERKKHCMNVTKLKQRTIIRRQISWSDLGSNLSRLVQRRIFIPEPVKLVTSSSGKTAESGCPINQANRFSRADTNIKANKLCLVYLYVKPSDLTCIYPQYHRTISHFMVNIVVDYESKIPIVSYSSIACNKVFYPMCTQAT